MAQYGGLPLVFLLGTLSAVSNESSYCSDNDTSPNQAFRASARAYRHAHPQVTKPQADPWCARPLLNMTGLHLLSRPRGGATRPRFPHPRREQRGNAGPACLPEAAQRCSKTAGH
jgi:hypothetical protein